jgi:signal transduction histidine kinase
MSLRILFRVVAAALMIAAGAMVTSLLVGGMYLHRTSERLTTTVDSVRATEGLELSLLVHNRSLHLLTLTGDANYAKQAANAEARLRRWLPIARSHATTEAEKKQLADVETKVDEYLATRGYAASSGKAAVELYGEQLGAPDKAYAAMEKLVDLNLAETEAVEASAARWDRLATWSEALVVVALVLIVAAVLIGLQSGVFRPTRQIRQAIARFGSGDPTSRAPEGGALELREVARAFNDMSAALNQQRESGLEFVAGVAHDLRNPLSALKTATSVFRDGRPFPEEARLRKLFEITNRQIDRLDRMIGDLIDRARIESGHLELNLEITDVRGVVQDGVELYRQAAPNHQFAVSTPNTAVLVNCDPHRLMQILENLFSNAVKYSPNGGAIDVLVAAEMSEAVVSISDTGVGMSSDDLSHLFEPFRRNGVSAKVAPGIGLGLSVTRRIVEAHGGRIQVESVSGVGSTFRVWLPLVVAPDDNLQETLFPSDSKIL